ncbi:MAG: ATP-binding protein [Bryobacteraceae bacterium]
MFYQVISTRHSQKRSTLITTNTAFSEWGNILYNTTIATAIMDRLVARPHSADASLPQFPAAAEFIEAAGNGNARHPRQF